MHEVVNESVEPLPSSSPTSSWITKSKSLSFRLHILRSRGRVFLSTQALAGVEVYAACISLGTRRFNC